MTHRLVMTGFCCAILFAFTCKSGFAQDAAQDKDRCGDLQSQAEMNACEADRYAKADSELNAVYKQLIAKHKSDAVFVQKLRTAQESWLKFRDADVASIYCHEDRLGFYGSVHPMCKSMVLLRLTVARTEELKDLLNPEEGDVCAFVADNTPACAAGNIGDEDQVTQAAIKVFWQALQDGLQKDDREKIARLVNYPLLVSASGGKFHVRSAKEFMADYAKIFPEDFRKFLLNQSAECVRRVGAQGFSVGHGEIWFDVYPDGKVRMFTINTVYPDH